MLALYIVADLGRFNIFTTTTLTFLGIIVLILPQLNKKKLPKRSLLLKVLLSYGKIAIKPYGTYSFRVKLCGLTNISVSDRDLRISVIELFTVARVRLYNYKIDSVLIRINNIFRKCLWILKSFSVNYLLHHLISV